MTTPTLEELAAKWRGEYLEDSSCWTFPNIDSCRHFYEEATSYGYAIWDAFDLAGRAA